MTEKMEVSKSFADYCRNLALDRNLPSASAAADLLMTCAKVPKPAVVSHQSYGKIPPALFMPQTSLPGSSKGKVPVRPPPSGGGGGGGGGAHDQYATPQVLLAGLGGNVGASPNGQYGNVRLQQGGGGYGSVPGLRPPPGGATAGYGSIGAAGGGGTGNYGLAGELVSKMEADAQYAQLKDAQYDPVVVEALDCMHWYSATTSRALAESILDSLDIGSFIVRRSSQPNSLALSVKRTREIAHHVLTRDRGVWTIEVGSKKTSSNTVVGLLEELEPYVTGV
jgi:hypothetical protein